MTSDETLRLGIAEVLWRLPALPAESHAKTTEIIDAAVGSIISVIRHSHTGRGQS